MLSFLVGSKQAFEASLADVSKAQLQGRNDVVLEFHVDDTTGANEVSNCWKGWIIRLIQMQCLQIKLRFLEELI